MTYEKANKEQRKVLKIMEERINHLYQNPMELTRAEEAWFYQRDLIERESLGREEGIAEGIAKGKAEGMVKAYVQCIVSFMKSQQISFEEAADLLDVPQMYRTSCREVVFEENKSSQKDE